LGAGHGSVGLCLVARGQLEGDAVIDGRVNRVGPGGLRGRAPFDNRENAARDPQALVKRHKKRDGRIFPPGAGQPKAAVPCTRASGGLCLARGGGGTTLRRLAGRRAPAPRSTSEGQGYRRTGINRTGDDGRQSGCPRGAGPISRQEIVGGKPAMLSESDPARGRRRGGGRGFFLTRLGRRGRGRFGRGPRHKKKQNKPPRPRSKGAPGGRSEASLRPLSGPAGDGVGRDNRDDYATPQWGGASTVGGFTRRGASRGRDKRGERNSKRGRGGTSRGDRGSGGFQEANGGGGLSGCGWGREMRKLVRLAVGREKKVRMCATAWAEFAAGVVFLGYPR